MKMNFNLESSHTKKKKGFSIFILALLIVAFLGIFLFLQKQGEMTKEKFIKNVEELLLIVNADILNRAFENQYVYQIEDGKISNLNSDKLDLREINGKIVFDSMGKVEYALHNDKWCIRKIGTEQQEVLDYIEDTCQIH